MEMTCDICADWSVAQWEQFVKKRAYKDRKKPSRPSGSVPPAPLTSPRAFSPSGVSRPGTSSSSSSSSCPSGGQGKQGGSQGAPGVVSREAPSPPARSRSSERGGSVSGLSSGARGRGPASPSPSGAGEVGAAHLQQTPPSHAAASAVSPHSSPHARRREESRETWLSVSVRYTLYRIESLIPGTGVRFPFLLSRVSWQRLRIPLPLLLGLRAFLYRPYQTREIIAMGDCYVLCGQSGVSLTALLHM